MNNNGLILGVATFSLSLVCAAISVDMTLYAGDDAVVKSSDPDGSYGTGEHLEWAVTAASPYEGVKSYLRFRLPEGVAGNITSATLRFTRSSVGPWTTYPKLYVLNDDASGQDWAESAIAWNNAPANRTNDYGFSASEASFIVQGSLPGYNAGGVVGEPWSINSGLTNPLNADTDQWVTFMVEWGSAPYAVAENFAAKEHATLSGPVLEITYTAAEYKDVKTLASERWHAWRKSRDRFPLAAWSYFSRYIGDEAEYQMYADAGLNMVQAPYNQTTAAMATGTDVLFGSWESIWKDPAKLSHYIDYPETHSQQVAGYLLYDEPHSDYFDELALSSEQVYRLDERDALPIIDMLPNYGVEYDRFGLGNGGGTHYQAYYETYIGKFVEDVSPCVMINSHYPIMYNGVDRPHFYMNVEYFRELALEHDIGLMGFALVNKHWNYREPSESDLNWMVYSYLAYGAQGLFYYNYRIGDSGFGEGLVTHADGTPHTTYCMAQAVNAELDQLWPVLRQLKSTAVFHTGETVPEDTTPYTAGASAAVATFSKDNFIIGDFVNQDDGGDTNLYVMLVNKHHGLGISSADAASTAVFTANSSYPYVSMYSPSSGEEMLLQADAGTYRLLLGGGKGILLRFSQYLTPGLPVRPPDEDIDPDNPFPEYDLTVLTPDADVDIRSSYPANGYDRSVMLVSNGGVDPSVSDCAKAYVRFKLPDDFVEALTATFEMSRTVVGAWGWTYDVSVLNDGVAGESNWPELDGSGVGTTWNNAPGNDPSSAYLFTDSTVVGTINSLRTSDGGVVGDRFALIDFSGALVDCLNADSNGYVTLMIGRHGVSTSSDQWASKENATSEWIPALSLKYLASTNYIDWMGGYPGVGSSTNMTDNPDGDSRDNLAEYAFGGNPDDPNDIGHAETVLSVEEGGANWFYYVHPKRKDAAAVGLTYDLRNSTNLVSSSWTSDDIEVLGVGEIDAAFNAVTNRIPSDTEPTQFLRLRIESD